MSDGRFALDPEEQEMKELWPQGSTEEHLGTIVEPLVRYTKEIAGGYEHSAPVLIPNREKLAVHLVDISQVHRLEELRSDATDLKNCFWVAIGGIVGFLTNIFMSNQGIDKKSWVLLALLFGAAVGFGFFAKRANNRAEELRRKILDETPKRTSEN